MNKNHVQLWVDALRSGEFEQGVGALNKGGKYCCLGVACEVAIKSGLSLGKEEIWNRTSYEGRSSIPPSIVNDFFSIDADIVSSLIDFNDRDNKPFSEIADWLEAQI